MMDFRGHLRTTGGALKNWAVAQLLDSLAVGVLWLIGLYILHVPLAPMWAVIAAVLQIVPHFGPILGYVRPRFRGNHQVDGLGTPLWCARTLQRKSTAPQLPRQ